MLIRERLSDSRYQANPLEEAEELMSFADTDIKKGEASPSYSSTQIDLLPKHIHHTAMSQWISNMKSLMYWRV